MWKPGKINCGAVPHRYLFAQGAKTTIDSRERARAG